jgi:hypothetical protein
MKILKFFPNIYLNFVLFEIYLFFVEEFFVVMVDKNKEKVVVIGISIVLSLFGIEFLNSFISFVC